MKTFQILAVTLALTPGFSPSARADWDYNAGFAAFSYPLAATFFGTFGYGKMLWGPNPLEWLPENGPAKKFGDWKFGFVRAFGHAQTLGVSSRAWGEVQFFPVSILGIAAGYGGHYRASKNPNYDCIIESCTGGLSRSYIRGQFVVGALGAFLIAHGRIDDFGNMASTNSFLEDTSSLFATGRKDRLKTTSMMLGYTIDPMWTVSTTWTRQQFSNGGANAAQNRQLTANVSRFSGKWNTTLMAGTFSSSHLKPGFTMGVMIQWMGSRNLGLF